MTTASIWKYVLAAQSMSTHQIPKGAKALHMGPDAEERLCVWFLVDPEQPKEERVFVVAPTGGVVPMDAAKDYVGTFVYGPYVNHVFVPCNKAEG
jgi:hypothetical protein